MQQRSKEKELFRASGIWFNVSFGAEIHPLLRIFILRSQQVNQLPDPENAKPELLFTAYV